MLHLGKKTTHLGLIDRRQDLLLEVVVLLGLSLLPQRFRLGISLQL